MRSSPTYFSGYDRVLWVEGETEREVLFHYFGGKMTNQSFLMGTAIRVQHTGDSTGKGAKNVIATYERLSQLEGGSAALLASIRQNSLEVEQVDLKRQGRD